MIIKRLLPVLFLIFAVFGQAFASSSDEGEKFNPAEMIKHHIADAHEWHLWGETAIYLPIIVKTENGLDIFSSSHLYHNKVEVEHDGHLAEGFAHTTDKGSYIMVHEHIYIADEHGHINEEASVLDFSITKNTLSLFIGALLLILVFVGTARKYNQDRVPKGLAKFMEPLVLFVRDEIVIPNVGEKKYKKFLPYLLTVFFFIWFNNMLGLIPVFPGGANLTGNIAVTAVLALATAIITNINGNKHYWGHIFAMPGVPKAVLLILTPVEILGIFTKPFALAIRLFANITAGHIVVLSLVSIIFIFKNYYVSPISGIMVLFISCLELLVAFIQAYVFTLLSALFIGTAVEEAHH